MRVLYGARAVRVTRCRSFHFVTYARARTRAVADYLLCVYYNQPVAGK